MMVPIPSFAPPILIVPDLVMDDVLIGEGATKECKTKLGKTWA